MTLTEAVLGGKVTAPTVDGPVSLTIPKGANSGTTLRLKGKGVGAGSARGDQFVKLKIVLPDASDPALEKFVEGWKRDYNVRGKLGV